MKRDAPRMLLAIAFVAAAAAARLALAADRPAAIETGKLAPDLKVEGWRGSAPLALGDVRGKVVLLAFWGARSRPSLDAVPRLRKLRDDLKGKDFVLVAIHVKKGADEMPALVEQRNIDWPVCVDATGDTAKAYRVRAIPHFVLIDRKSIAREADLALDDARAAIDKLLDEK